MKRLEEIDVVTKDCIEKRLLRGTRYFEDANGVVVAKECTKCLEIKLVDEFHKHSKNWGGYRSECKACKSNRGIEYRKANLENELKKDRERYKKKDPQKMREKAKKYYKTNPESQKKANKKWQEANPDAMREANERWKNANPEEYRNRARRWQLANKEKLALNVHIRRARKSSLPDTFTLEQHTSTLSYFNGGCALTGSVDYHMDHVIPIACGHGGTTFENMIPLRNDLNHSKHTTHIFEWFEVNHKRFDLSQKKFDALIEYLSEINEMTVQEYRKYVDWCFDNTVSFADKITENKQMTLSL